MRPGSLPQAPIDYIHAGVAAPTLAGIRMTASGSKCDRADRGRETSHVRNAPKADIDFVLMGARLDVSGLRQARLPYLGNSWS